MMSKKELVSIECGHQGFKSILMGAKIVWINANPSLSLVTAPNEQEFVFVKILKAYE